MLAIDEVYWTVNDDRTRLTVSTEPPIDEISNRLDPEPKNYRLPFALGLFALGNLGDALTTIHGLNLGADEVNPFASRLFDAVGVTTGVFSLKLLLILIVSLITTKMWKRAQYRYTLLSLVYFANGIYAMVTFANWYNYSGITN